MAVLMLPRLSVSEKEEMNEEIHYMISDTN